MAENIRKEQNTPAANHKLSAASTVCLAAATQDERGLLGMELPDGAKLMLGHSTCLGTSSGTRAGAMGRGRKHLALELNFQYQL